MMIIVCLIRVSEIRSSLHVSSRLNHIIRLVVGVVLVASIVSLYVMRELRLLVIREQMLF